VASVVHALDHGTELHGHAVAAALVGMALAFGTWLGYFEVTRAHDEREVEDAAGGRNLRLWAYGHVPIYVGVFSLAAGTVAMAGESTWSAPQLLLYIAGIALTPLGLALLRVASVRKD
jgi:low temperature requirement protein LtrA